MNINVNKYYDYRRKVLGTYMASGELNSKGINYLPYGVFK